MPRPPLPIGTYGAITTQRLTDGSGYRAFARFRDHDGVARKIERTGRSATAAKNRLKEHLRDRASRGPADGLTGESRFRAAAEQWISTEPFPTWLETGSCWSGVVSPR